MDRANKKSVFRGLFILTKIRYRALQHIKELTALMNAAGAWSQKQVDTSSLSNRMLILQ